LIFLRAWNKTSLATTKWKRDGCGRERLRGQRIRDKLMKKEEREEVLGERRRSEQRFENGSGG
jgi:hypothetical protein